MWKNKPLEQTIRAGRCFKLTRRIQTDPGGAWSVKRTLETVGRHLLADRRMGQEKTSGEKNLSTVKIQ